MAAFLSPRPLIHGIAQSWRRAFGPSELPIEPSNAEVTSAVPPETADDELLFVRMRALGFDRAAVARYWPILVLDMHKNCVACDSRAPCEADLKAHERGRPDTQTWQDYCPNVATLNMVSSLLPAMKEVAPRLQSRDI